MGILYTILGTTTRAASKAAKNACEGIEKVGEVITGKSLASNLIEKSNKNCLIINLLVNPNSNILNWIKSIFKEEFRFYDYYHILDEVGNIKYIIKYKSFCINRKIFGLYNINDDRIGHIEINNFKRNDVDIKTCSLFIDKNNVINLKKYKNSYDIYSTMDKRKLKLYYNKLNTYEFKLEEESIGRTYVTRTKKTEKYIEKYVLEYENIENEILDILLTIAIDLLNTKE